LQANSSQPPQRRETYGSPSGKPKKKKNMEPSPSQKNPTPGKWYPPGQPGDVGSGAGPTGEPDPPCTKKKRWPAIAPGKRKKTKKMANVQAIRAILRAGIRFDITVR
jgi:hypothetical protein